jgi:leucyl aminopeptidase
MPLEFAADTEVSVPLFIISSGDWPDWIAARPETEQRWANAAGFRATLGAALALPDGAGGVAAAVVGHGDAAARARTRFGVARAVGALPAGVYHLATDLPAPERDEAALAWLLAGYRFDRYRKKPDSTGPARMKAPAGVDARRLEIIAAAEVLTRDLINTPSNDMGPDELEAAFMALAAEHGAQAQAIRGDDLHSANLPLIHAVGRASPRAPRLLDMRWGDAGPRLTLVGKGVCFDTGGLNLKPGNSMGLMKKDMGGAATVLGLAHAIMALGWKVRLRVLVPAVENSVSGASFRPGDILPSRKGLTVEVNNTDAEGRLVLADALALADEETPDAIICMATLTGAARVALGTDIMPFFTDDDALAGALVSTGAQVRDPVWRMPFHPAYERQIEPGIADLDNAPSGGMGGAITAALFLRRFVSATPVFAHFDIYGWQATDAPARPKGGQGMGARALLAALPERLGL